MYGPIVITLVLFFAVPMKVSALSVAIGPTPKCLLAWALIHTMAGNACTYTNITVLSILLFMAIAVFALLHFRRKRKI